MRCDFAEWLGPLPATNFRHGPTTKIGVVHHVIVGSVTGANTRFHQSGVELSAHFGVADGGDRYPDGHLVQWLDTDDVSYAQVNGNANYISVETAGDSSTPWTAAQIATLGRLDAWAAKLHGFPLQLVDHGGAGLTTHAHYPTGVPDPSWGNHPCPGGPRIAQMPAVLDAARPQPPPPPQEIDMGMALVPSWATLKANGRCEWYQAVQGNDPTTFFVYSFNGAQLDRVDGVYAGQWFMRLTGTGPVVGLAEIGSMAVALCDGGGGGVYRIGDRNSAGRPA